MKKIKISFIMLVMLIILPITVFAAGSIQPSPRNLSITRGSTKTFNITASNACGKVEVYSSNPAVATVNVSSRWIENETITVTVTGVSAGSASISVRLSDAATFDEEELTGSYTVNVTVSEPQNNNGGTTNNNNNNNNKPTNNVQNNLSKNNKIGTLTVEGYELINKDNNTYELTVTNNVTNININATAEDAKATVSGTGNKNLEIGLNTFEIIVKAESGALNKYIVNVTRKDAIYLEDFNSVVNNIDGDIIDVMIYGDSKITQENLEKIKETKKTVKFNYKEGDKIIYSWIVNGTELNNTSEINTKINFTSEHIEEIGMLSNYANGMYLNFEHREKLPEGIKIKIYVGNEFFDGNILNLYYYNKEINSLENIKNGMAVSEGYTELNVESLSNYFFTRATIRKIAESEDEKINIFLIVAIIEFVIIIGLIIYYLKNKINKEGEKC